MAEELDREMSEQYLDTLEAIYDIVENSLDRRENAVIRNNLQPEANSSEQAAEASPVESTPPVESQESQPEPITADSPQFVTEPTATQSGEVAASAPTESQPIKFFASSRKVYERVPGKEAQLIKASPEQVQKLQTAIDNPQELQGSVRVIQGEEVLYHVKNGEVITDKLGLSVDRTQEQAQTSTETADATDATVNAEVEALQTPQTPEAEAQPTPPVVEEVAAEAVNAEAEALQTPQTPEVAAQTTPSTVEEATAETVNAGVDASQTSLDNGTTPQAESETDVAQLQAELAELRSTVERQQEQLSRLNQFLTREPQPSQAAVASQRLGNWLNKVRDTVKEAGQNLSRQLSGAIEKTQQRSSELIERIDRSEHQKAQAILKNASDRADRIYNGVDRKTQAIGKVNDVIVGGLDRAKSLADRFVSPGKDSAPQAYTAQRPSMNFLLVDDNILSKDSAPVQGDALSSVTTKSTAPVSAPTSASTSAAPVTTSAPAFASSGAAAAPTASSSVAASAAAGPAAPIVAAASVAAEVVSTTAQAAADSVSEAAASASAQSPAGDPQLDSAARTLVNKLGHNTDSGREYTATSFTFVKEAGEVSIRSNASGTTVFEKGQFTSNATPEDRQKLSQLPSSVNQRLRRTASQTNNPSRSRGR